MPKGVCMLNCKLPPTTAAPPTTAPPTTAPATTAPPTTAPPTTAPPTTAPPTTAPPTTAPPTTAPPTTAPPTTAPPTTAPPTTAPPTTAPPTTAPPTTAPATTAPPTTAPPTTAPPTTAPATTAPPTTAPPTTAVPTTAVPTTHAHTPPVPATTVPPTTAAPTTAAPTTASPTTLPPGDPRILFLYFEAKGLDGAECDSCTPKITRQPDLPINIMKNTSNYFEKIVIVVPNDARGIGSTPQARTLDIFRTIKTTITTEIGINVLPIEYWLEVYFGSDGPFCTLNSSGCDGSGCCQDCPRTTISPPETPLEQLQHCLVKRYFNSFGSGAEEEIKGIIIDDEVGDSTKYVFALSQLKNNKYPNITSPPSLQNITLAWSGDTRDGKLPYPKSAKPTLIELSEIKQAKWEYFLGQAYTQCNGEPGCRNSDVPHFYENGSDPDCLNFSNDFWTNIETDFDSGSEVTTAKRGVPMVCGGGNCQLKKFGSNTIWDERMSKINIENLIRSRPSNFKWKNFAIWYGTANYKKAPETPKTAPCSEMSGGVLADVYDASPCLEQQS